MTDLTTADLDHIDMSADCVDDEGMVLVSDQHLRRLIAQARQVATIRDTTWNEAIEASKQEVAVWVAPKHYVMSRLEALKSVAS